MKLSRLHSAWIAGLLSAGLGLGRDVLAITLLGSDRQSDLFFSITTTGFFTYALFYGGTWLVTEQRRVAASVWSCGARQLAQRSLSGARARAFAGAVVISAAGAVLASSERNLSSSVVIGVTVGLAFYAQGVAETIGLPLIARDRVDLVQWLSLAQNAVACSVLAAALLSTTGRSLQLAFAATGLGFAVHAAMTWRRLRRYDEQSGRQAASGRPQHSFSQDALAGIGIVFVLGLPALEQISLLYQSPGSATAASLARRIVTTLPAAMATPLGMLLLARRARDLSNSVLRWHQESLRIVLVSTAAGVTALALSAVALPVVLGSDSPAEVWLYGAVLLPGVTAAMLQAAWNRGLQAAGDYSRGARHQLLAVCTHGLAIGLSLWLEQPLVGLLGYSVAATVASGLTARALSATASEGR